MSIDMNEDNPMRDLDEFIRNLTWANDDFPEANCALLEGLRLGFTGYVGYKNVRRLNRNESPPPSPPPEPTLHKYEGESPESSSSGTSESSEQKPHSQINLEAAGECIDLHDVLNGTTVIGPVPRPSSAPPLKRNSALTVRPTIGEERKAWIMEAKRAYYLAELQRTCPNPMSYNCNDEDQDNVLYRYHMHHHEPSQEQLQQQPQSHSCPDFLRSHPKSSNGTSVEDGDVEEKDSCTILYNRMNEDNPSQSEIRLSPRIEKLDKLIPKTSNDFQNTMLYVNTIFPPQSGGSSETNRSSGPTQNNSPRSTSHTYAMMARMSVKELNGTSGCAQTPRIPKEGENVSNQNHNAHRVTTTPKLDVGPPKPVNTTTQGKSYKEAFLFGNQSSTRPAPTPAAVSKTEGTAMPQQTHHPDHRSSSSFPSLPKLARDRHDHSHSKQSPPLYSSILQRNPEFSVTKLKAKSSPVQVPLSHDQYHYEDNGYSSDCSTKHSSQSSDNNVCCVFCRSNDESECVYKSHTIRDENGIVICPILRKYVCCFCGATGDEAHTMKYCPNNPIGYYNQKQSPHKFVHSESVPNNKSEKNSETQRHETVPAQTKISSDADEWTEAKNKKKLKRK